MLTVGSLCSGVGGFDLGFHRAGFRTAWFCEYDEWRRGILARHWPGVPCYPDISTFDPSIVEPVDVLIGGTPCQDLSTAGKRAGLAGERSGLFFHFIRIRNALNPKWTVWENVDGALTSHRGMDFARVLASFVGGELAVPPSGWGSAGVATGPWGSACWRVLNSQWFGVAQRRRRVFVVGHLGGPYAEQVLLESPGVCGDSPPSYETGRDAAATLTSGSSNRGVSAPGRRREDDVNLAVDDASLCLLGHPWRGDGRQALIAFNPTGGALDGWYREDGVSPPLKIGSGIGLSSGPAVAFHENQRGEQLRESDYAAALGTGGGKPGQGFAAVRDGVTVRRLTPTERERLQGWPDGWTIPEGPSLADAPTGPTRDPDIPDDPLPDSPREAATGDGVTANVAEWIAGRILAVEELNR